MNVVQRFKTAPNTVVEAKKNIFAPFEKEKKEPIDEVIFKSGNIEISLHGYKLNQIHRDILDIAFYYGDNSVEKKVKNLKRPVRIFTLYDIQKHLNYESKYNNYWIDEKFQELKRTTIRVKVDNDWIEFNILDVAQYSEKQGNKYALVVSELYMSFFENQISINYKDYLDTILTLSSGQAKALARYVLSFSNDFKIELDNLMLKIGINENITEQAFRYNRRRILENKEQLEKLNIKIEKISSDKRKADYMVSYEKLPNVKIYHPKQKNQLTLF